MNWYLNCGKDSDVVISTRIRYARNFRNYKFNVKTKEEAEKISNEIKDKVQTELSKDARSHTQAVM